SRSGTNVNLPRCFFLPRTHSTFFAVPTAPPFRPMLFLYAVVLFLIGVFRSYLEALPWLLLLTLPSTALQLVAGYSETRLSRLSLAQEINSFSGNIHSAPLRKRRAFQQLPQA